MYNDPIADLLTRIRNSQTAGKDIVYVPYSKVKHQICEVMKKHKFIADVKKVSNKHDELEITLDLVRPHLTLKRISKPGQRIYKKASEFQSIKSGLGIDIVSTSKGIMPQYQAYKENIGGEVLCRIY
jgi:small subunit ribosomal protein S8